MVPPLFVWTPECFLQVIHHSYSGVRSTNYAPCVSKIASSRYKFANLCYKFSLHERGLSADWKAEREARSPSHLQVDVWAFRKMAAALHADPLNRPSPKL